MAPGIKDEGVRGDGHGPQLLAFLEGLGIVEIIQAEQVLPDVPLEVGQAPLIDFAVEDRMPGSPLLHELGENARFVGMRPFGRHLGENFFPDRLPCPERDDALFVSCSRPGADRIGDFLARIQDIEIPQAVDVDLRVSGHHLRGGTPLPHDEFPGPDPDGLPFQKMAESQGAFHGRGKSLSGMGFVEVRHQERPLGGQDRLGRHAFFPQFPDARVHRSFSPDDFESAFFEFFPRRGDEFFGRRLEHRGSFAVKPP